MDRKTFLRDLEPYFSNGLAWEIHSHKKGSIMNMANSLYIASMYLKSGLGYPIGIIVPKQVAKAGVEDWLNLLEWFNSLSLEEKEKCVMLFTPRTLEVAVQTKAQTDIEGPSKDVDLEWEQSLKGKRKGL